MALLVSSLVILIVAVCTEGQDFTIEVNPTQVLLPKGSPVYLDCTTKGKDKPTVTWVFGEENNVDFKIFPNNTLYIKSLTREYKGKYTCSAELSGNTKYGFVNVDIAVLKKMPPMPDDYQQIGGQVNITCPKPSRFNPDPTISWQVDGGKPLPQDPRYTVKGWSLVISGLKQQDARNYTCVVANIAGVRKQTMKLTVYVIRPVVVAPKVATVIEGKTTMFHCKSYSSPPFPNSKLVWRKSTTVLKNDARHSIFPNGTLKISKVMQSDNGSYDCRFEMKKLGSSYYRDVFDIIVFEKVKINTRVQQNKQNLDRLLNKMHVVHCAFSGSGPITVKWSKKGLLNLPSRMKPLGGKLIIKQLEMDDKGNYTCSAKGKYNSVSAVVNVIVYEGPRFTEMPKDIKVKEGETAKTVCKGKGRPAPKISWMGAKKAKLPANFKEEKNTLIVEKAVQSNAGEYSCVLSNGMGINSTSFNIVVEKSEGGTGPSKGGQQSMGRTVGIAVGCAGAYIVLVIGLMIYCRRRRSRLLKKQGNAMVEVEDGEFNKDLLENGDDEFAMNGDLKNIEKWKVPREDIEELKTLGHGKLGKIALAKLHRESNIEKEVLVAVKHLAKQNEASREAFDRELHMMTQLHHEHVIKLFGVCIDDYPMLIVTEYSEQGTLKHCLTAGNKNEKRPTSINASKKLRICSQIACGMEYLSANGIIHQDLASRNCLVVTKDFDVKVAFFSLSEDAHSKDYYLYKDAHVPLRWLSPEALFDENYSEKSGVWAFGVVVWEVYSLGKQPYPDITDEAVLKTLKKNLSLTRPTGCPEELYALLMNCCRINPDERPKFSEIVTLMDEIPVDSNV